MEKENQNMIKTGCDRGLCAQAVGRQDRQLNTYDWLADIPGNAESTDLVEVQFKHTRKGYYHNVNHLTLKKGDIVAVEANPGHDIGVVTLIGRLVKMQIKKANLKSADDIKRIYRIARPIDMDKFKEAKAREHETMIQSREIAKSLGLQMKIGDVEYQGDCNKAIFYYIADERVDFRQLIKVLADTFHVRIEMKQIGARQEAGRIGGTGPCGRELCCATWMKNFVSVSTNAARYQDISLNPQKLAGMCAKLKCCLNYEVDDYIEASKNLPSREVVLQTKDGDYYLFKTDILAGIITYSTDKNMASNLEEITAQRAKEIIEMNRNGEKPLSLQEDGKKVEPKKPVDLLSEDINRFDKSKKKKKKGNRDGANQRPQGQDGEDSRMNPSTDDNTTDVQEPNGKDTPRPQGPRSDRPRGPRGDRPQRPRGDRPQGPKGDRPQGPRGDRPRGDRPQGPRGGNGPRQQGPGRNNQPRQQQPDQQAGPQINQQPHQQPDQQPSQQQNKEASQRTDNAE
jgi:cell fate regulator YaaT (PSP1 superfamily)